MTAAPSLEAAAGQAYDDLNGRYVANQLKLTLTTFWQNNIDVFPQAQLAAHPVSNWLTIIAAIADQLPGSGITLTQLTAAVEAVYRLCWMASFLQATGGISVAQGNTLLASYNTVIGF